MSKTKNKLNYDVFLKTIDYFKIEETKSLDNLKMLLGKKFLNQENKPITNEKNILIIIFLKSEMPRNRQVLNLQELVHLLEISKITNHETTINILSEFLKSPVAKVNDTDFVTIINLINSNYFGSINKNFLKNKLVSRFLTKKAVITSDIGNFLDILEHLDNQDDNVIEFFLNQIPPSREIASDSTLTLNQQDNILSTDAKLSFIKLFIENNNTKVSTKELIDVLNHFDNADQSSVIDIIKLFLFNKNNTVTTEDFFLIQQNKHLQDLDYKHQIEFVNLFLKNTNSTPNFEFLLWALEIAKKNVVDCKTSNTTKMIKHFLLNKKSTFDIGDLQKIMSIIPKNKTTEIIDLIKNLVIENHDDKINTAKDICDLICLQNPIRLNNSYAKLISNFIISEKATAQDLSYIFSRLSSGIGNAYKESLIIKFLKNLENEIAKEGEASDINLTGQELGNLIKTANLNNELDSITRILKTYISYDADACRDKPLSTKILNTLSLFDYLNPSLFDVKIVLLNEVILGNLTIEQDDISESLEIIGGFLEKITSSNYDDLIDGLIKNMKYCGYISSVADELKLLKNSIYFKYPLLFKVFNKIENDKKDDYLLNPKFSFEKYFTAKGIEEIHKILKLSFEKNDMKEITILNILSYYEFRKKTKDLAQFIQPEIIEEIKQGFETLSKDNLLVSKKEKKIFDSLLKIEIDDDLQTVIIIEDESTEDKTITDKKLISNKVLCSYFKEKITPFTYTNQQLNFNGTVIDDDSQIRLNDLFAIIMRADLDISTNPNNPELKRQREENIENITKFFTSILNIDISNITDGKDKIFSFFKTNRNSLAYALTNENIGITEFSERALGSAIKDGCSKNIGSIFTTILYGSILKNEFDKLLYFVMGDKIIGQILNSGGDIIGNDNDPLSNNSVLDYYISLDALKKEIINSCSGDEKLKIVYKAMTDDFKCNQNGLYKAMEIFRQSYDTDEDLNVLIRLEEEYMDNLTIYALLKNINILPQNVNEHHNIDNETDTIEEIETNHLKQIADKLKLTIPYEQMDNLWTKIKDEVSQHKDTNKDDDQLESNPSRNPSNSKAEILDINNQINAQP